MQRISKQEIEQAKAALAQWQTPEAMLAIPNPVDSVTFYNQAGLAFLRDAWIAGEFAKARNAEQVRLVSDEWPDFELRIGNAVEAFEAVEADNPERRRGDEYTEEEIDKVRFNPIENWIADAEAAPGWIRRACERKVAKRYAGRAHLVIYLNMSEFGVRQKETEACFFDATQPAHGVFESVWLLWNGKAYEVTSKVKAQPAHS